MAVQVDTVDLHGLGVGGGLTRGLDDRAALVARQRAAREGRSVEVRVPRRRHGQAVLGEQAFGRTDTTQPGRELYEEPGAERVAGGGDVAPAGKDRTRAVESWKVRQAAPLGDRGVDLLTHGDQARRQQAGAAPGPFGEVAHHAVAGPARFVGDRDVAHGRHDDAILERDAVDLDGREEMLEGIELAAQAALRQSIVAQKPGAVLLGQAPDHLCSVSIHSPRPSRAAYATPRHATRSAARRSRSTGPPKRLVSYGCQGRQ